MNKERKPLIDQLPLPRPLGVYVESSNLCNLSCVWCGLSNKKEYYRKVGEFRELLK